MPAPRRPALGSRSGDGPQPGSDGPVLSVLEPSTVSAEGRTLNILLVDITKPVDVERFAGVVHQVDEVLAGVVKPPRGGA